MDEKEIQNQTLQYYADHAESFSQDTGTVDFSPVQKRFLALLPDQGKILDFGCGSGRDAKAFLDAGYTVEAWDGCPQLCALAEKRIGQPVSLKRFSELEAISTYSGIWACSSILHLPEAELACVMQKIMEALIPSGIFYTSFKYGAGSGMRNGRWFTNFTEDTFLSFITRFDQLEVLELWKSGDVRPGREQERWLNILMEKK